MAGIGASRPFPRIPAKVAFCNRMIAVNFFFQFPAGCGHARTPAPRRERGELGQGRVRTARSAAWMPFTETGRSPGTTELRTRITSTLTWPDPASVRGQPDTSWLPHDGVRWTGRPSSHDVVIRTVFAIRRHGDLHGLDRSRRPARSCARRCRLCARSTLRRDGRGGRIAELEFAAGDPDAVHDHRELAGHGDSGALDTAPFGDGDTPSPKA